MEAWRTKSISTIIILIIFFTPFINPEMIIADQLEVGALNIPPFYVVKSNTHVEGILIDLISKILKRASIDYVIRGYPAKRLYKNLVEGSTNIWLGSKETPIYKQDVLASEFPVTNVELRIYALGDKELPSTKQELRGKSIITIRGYGYGGWIDFLEHPENNIIIDIANSQEAAFLMLEAGRADFLLNYKKAAEIVLQSHPIKGLRHNYLNKYPLYITVSKRTKNAQEVLRRITESYRQLSNEGEIE